MQILGLDISTSITGATILNENGEIVLCESWDMRNPKKFPSFYEKILFVYERLKLLPKVDLIFVEDSVLSFQKGLSSAKTISTLAKFNGAVSALVFLKMEKCPSHLSASRARKIAGVKTRRGEKPKPIVLERVTEIYPDFHVKRTRTGSISPETYDRADSVIIARAGWEEWRKTKLDS